MRSLAAIITVAFIASLSTGQAALSLSAQKLSSVRHVGKPDVAQPKRSPSAGITLASSTIDVSTVRAALTSGSFAMLGGVNLSGLELNSSVRPGVVYYNWVPPSFAEIDYYASKGLRLIRLPFLWERLQSSLQATNPSTSLDTAYLQLIRNILVHAAADGMGVVIDMHNYGAYNGIKIGAAGGLTVTQFGAAWNAIATALEGTPGLLGYDIMNEPNKMPSSAVWPSAAQAAVTAIRKVDKVTPVFVEGDSYASAGSWQAVNGQLNISDPSNLTIYEAHVYGDRDNSGTHYNWTTETSYGVTINTIAQRESVFGNWCKTRSELCIIGEVGVGVDNAAWDVELQLGLAQAKADGLLAGFYWAGGPWWGSYPMSIEPINGVDKPQMSVMTTLAK